MTFAHRRALAAITARPQDHASDRLTRLIVDFITDAAPPTGKDVASARV